MLPIYLYQVINHNYVKSASVVSTSYHQYYRTRRRDHGHDPAWMAEIIEHLHSKKHLNEIEESPVSL